MKRLCEIGPILRQRHRGQVRKLCLRVGATCPNRDGRKGTGGCFFCGEEPAEALELELQLEQGLKRRRQEGTALIAYLQDHTATYLPADQLDRYLTTIQQAHDFVGVTIGTRPDCLDDDVLSVLERHASSGPPLLVELGLQSACDATLELINRCHDVASFRSAVDALHHRGVRVCAHVILGLPTPAATPGRIAVEGVDHVRATAALIDRLGVEAVKIHNCHVLRGTPLAELHAEGRYEPPSLEAYIELLIAFVRRLPAEVELHRLVGEVPAARLIAPAFTADKARTLRRIRSALEERDVWQGEALSGLTASS